MSDKSDSNKKLRNIVTTLEKLFECPVCLEVLRVPYKTCTNRHSICQSCVKNLAACPSCQGEILSEAPVVPINLQNLLEVLPQFCKYSNEGCEELVECGDKSHEEFCGFRPVICIEYNCGTKVSLINLLEHYEEIHSGRFFAHKTPFFLIWPDFAPEVFKQDLYPMYFNNNWIWVKVVNDTEEKCLKVKCLSTPIGLPQSDFYLTCKLSKDKFIYSYTMKAVVVSHIPNYEETGSTNGEEDDMSDSSESEEEENGEYEFEMKVPQSVLKQFKNEKGHLEYSCEFFEHKDEP